MRVFQPLFTVLSFLPRRKVAMQDQYCSVRVAYGDAPAPPSLMGRLVNERCGGSLQMGEEGPTGTPGPAWRMSNGSRIPRNLVPDVEWRMASTAFFDVLTTHWSEAASAATAIPLDGSEEVRV
jgi:hypothetical protein